MCRDQFLFFRKVKNIYKNKNKKNKNHGGIVYSDLKYVCSASLGGCGGSAGGGGGSRKANEGGVGTDGSSCGDMGMGDCRASPKVLPVMPSRISLFFQEA